MAKRKTHAQLLDEYREACDRQGYMKACESEGYSVTATEWDEIDTTIDKVRAAILRRMRTRGE